ncbi:MAG: hydroxymethylpyrimidine/phosphomethylpyrimidine kinase [Actinobacteria bacterium]|nr:MAG: hydroxymethylpyrimidine/phosphomethylpyrimidine kinase [Actinomycetota bacterium]
MPRALTIAGSDSGGGAGIQADLKTFAVLGVWGMTAVTSITVQNTEGVEAVSDVPPEIVGAQIRAVAGDIGVDAAKTGMLSTTQIIEEVAEAVLETSISNLVVDPVFVSKHGDPLLRDEAVEALRKRIVPLSTRSEMEEAARAILGLGARAVLVKGGHLRDDRADDLFAEGDRMEWLAGERIDTPDTHGTGCVLSAAIAAHLARGDPLEDAVLRGKEFVTEAIRHGLRIGQGIGPVSPGWRLLADRG